MNKRLLSIIISAVVALLAVVMVNTYLNREKQRYNKPLEEVPVVVAVQNIPKGTTIHPSMLTTINFPKDYLQPAAIQIPGAAINKIALGDILKGEQILDTKLTFVRKVEDSAAVRLPQGTRAFTIKFSDPLLAVGGQIRANDHVDIIYTFPYTQNIEGRAVTENVSVTLFQNILVMNVTGDGVFTFSLLPQQCAILSYAMTQGSLRLVLRQTLDSNIEPVLPVEYNVLLQHIFSSFGKTLTGNEPKKEEPVEPPPQPEPPQTLKIYKGSRQEQMEIRK